MRNFPAPPRLAWAILTKLAKLRFEEKTASAYLYEIREDINLLYMEKKYDDFYSTFQEHGARAAHLICWKEILVAFPSLLSPWYWLRKAQKKEWNITMQVKHRSPNKTSRRAPRPPKFGRFLLKACVPKERRQYAIGDVEGEFKINWKDVGPIYARLLYCQQIWVECFPAIARLFRWLLTLGLIRHLEYWYHRIIG